MPFILIVIIALIDVIILFATHGRSDEIEIVRLVNPVVSENTEQLKVMTINMAHGRANGRNQILQSNKNIINNVSAIGQLVAREDPHIVAMQEADSPSWWSGGFSHVNAVGKTGGMASAIQGLHVDGLGLSYGASIVTKLEAIRARQITFKKNFPTFSKGFVVVTCVWPGDSTFEFDVISLHLDFASDSVRKYQLSILSELVRNSTRPVILMGDFNTDMSEPLLPAFLRETNLRTWKVEDNSIVTFPFLGTRIDWIFVSSDLELVEQSVLGDILSDHSILTAVIQRK